MSNHKIALVPIATSYFQSPELLMKGLKADIGLFAESLIYYDSVYVHLDNPEQFAAFIKLLLRQGLSYKKLTELVEEGILRFFMSGLIMPYSPTGNPKIISSLWFIKEEGMDRSDYFENKYLNFKGLKNNFLSTNEYRKFCEYSTKVATVLSDDDFAEGLIDNAFDDCFNIERYKLISKNILEELYRINNLGKVPDFEVKITELNSKNYDEIAKNFESTVIGRNVNNNDEYKIHEIIDENLSKPIPSLEDKTKNASLSYFPLICAGQSNLYIKSANSLNCDLFLTTPISRVVGDKIYESNQLNNKKLKLQNTVESLQSRVELPDLRSCVNDKSINFKEVLEIRKEAKKFREWLQSESDRDRDAIIAYHNEIAKKTGLAKLGESVLNLFGVISPIGLSMAAEALLEQHDTLTKEAIKRVGTKTIEGFTKKIAAKLFKEWKPICFGNWYKDEIEIILKKSDKH